MMNTLYQPADVDQRVWVLYGSFPTERTIADVSQDMIRLDRLAGWGTDPIRRSYPNDNGEIAYRVYASAEAAWDAVFTRLQRAIDQANEQIAYHRSLYEQWSRSRLEAD